MLSLQEPCAGDIISSMLYSEAMALRGEDTARLQCVDIPFMSREIGSVPTSVPGHPRVYRVALQVGPEELRRPAS